MGQSLPAQGQLESGREVAAPLRDRSGARGGTGAERKGWGSGQVHRVKHDEHAQGGGTSGNSDSGGGVGAGWAELGPEVQVMSQGPSLGTLRAEAQDSPMHPHFGARATGGRGCGTEPGAQCGVEGSVFRSYGGREPARQCGERAAGSRV